MTNQELIDAIKKSHLKEDDLHSSTVFWYLSGYCPDLTIRQCVDVVKELIDAPKWSTVTFPSSGIKAYTCLNYMVHKDPDCPNKRPWMLEYKDVCQGVFHTLTDAKEYAQMMMSQGIV